MLRSVKELTGFDIVASDGEIGKVSEFYFDDQTWTIRYLIADTGNWLMSRLVLISPEALGKPDWDKKEFPVKLTKKQVEESPEITKDRPVSKQQEHDLTNYYGWPYYWTGMSGGIPGAIPYTVSMEANASADMRNESEEPKGDPHLRSTDEVDGYTILAKDGEIGHVKDFIVDDETWTIRYLIVNTNKWLPGGKDVIIALTWIKDIDWLETRVVVDLDKNSIQASPEFESETELNRNFENKLHEHYGRRKYWEEG